ncbi:hypothetical protein NPX13_g860 [Xylaria arbuscula]|uniref:Zn(2)-C6 fungal-type domain-containing protein n=1 Tax=Xylaria arbuscula TaxID=114810 RepID=A0A9W8TS87_9PEZI|nr:hypothetical protein NPX13_g860 [Xylaria arbuscula]
MAGADANQQQKDRSTTRAVQACNPCRQRKGRCDGKRPCRSCQQHASDCIYEDRQRRRGPGRSKEYIRLLESRLRDVASAELQASTLGGTHVLCTASSGRISINDAHLANDTSEGVSVREAGIEGSQRARPALNITSRSEVANADGKLSLECDPLASNSYLLQGSEVVGTRSQSNSPRNNVRAEEAYSLIPAQDIVSFLESTIDSLNTRYPFLSSPLLFDQLSTQDPTTNLAWRGLLDAVMAMGMLMRSPSSEITAAIQVAQVNCRNAYAQILQVVDPEPTILTIEALLSIGLFMKLTSNTRTAAQVISQVIRIFQMISLQTGASCLVTSGEMDERHLRAFWTAYILDMEITTQCGLPPTIHDDEFGVVILRPETIRSMQGMSKALQSRAEVAAMEKIIYQRLYRKSAFEQEENELMLEIGEIDWGLGYWRLTMSPRPQPDVDNPLTNDNLDFGVFVLHLAYYSCVNMASWAVRRHSLNKDPAVSHPSRQAGNFRVASAIEKSKRAARAILSMFIVLEGLQFINLWNILCYPMSAMITLLVGVLEDPLSSSTNLDLDAMRSFCDFLETAVGEGYDLRRALQACAQMEKLAQNAVHAAQALLETSNQGVVAEGREQSLPDEVLSSQVHMIKEPLTSCANPMYVAHGLMENIRTRDSPVTDILSKVLGIPKKDDRQFGLLTPECFRSKAPENVS